MEWWWHRYPNLYFCLLCSVDGASLYNLVNKANLVHNVFSVYLSISICFGRLCAHHQEKQLCLCDTWYLLFCVDDCLVCRVEWNSIPDSHPHRITSTKCRMNSCFSWWWAHSRPKHVEIDKYTKNKLCTKLALCTRLYVCILVITSPWRRSECRPKHVCNNTVNKINQKYWSAFCWLFVYFGSDSRAESGTH